MKALINTHAQIGLTGSSLHVSLHVCSVTQRRFQCLSETKVYYRLKQRLTLLLVFVFDFDLFILLLTLLLLEEDRRRGLIIN